MKSNQGIYPWKHVRCSLMFQTWPKGRGTGEEGGVGRGWEGEGDILGFQI